jgi:hypothetical protein
MSAGEGLRRVPLTHSAHRAGIQHSCGNCAGHRRDGRVRRSNLVLGARSVPFGANVSLTLGTAFVLTCPTGQALPTNSLAGLNFC